MRAAYDALAAAVGPLGEEESWRPTACAGWAVRDLVLHLLTDAQRALVALHTPASGPADRTAVTYWQDWRPDEDGAADERRRVRVSASLFQDWRQLRDRYLETAAAAVTAAGAAPPDGLVATQGRVLTADDLIATLAVEASIHHLDLRTGLPVVPAPSAAGLALVRVTLDRLLGRPVPVEWTDEHYARAATGRLPLTEEERHAFGADADRLPLFG
jgi:uncharacterized protein (TIGR03083 family)